MGFLSVTIDLDEIDCYLAIHGLAPQKAGSLDAVYKRGLPRAVRFFDDLGVKATFFVVGKDLARSADARSLAKQLAEAGHEPGNHTMNHPYDFSIMATAAQAKELDDGESAIFETTGKKPVGFRAPGYNINLSVMLLLKERGYHYDSSLFPCPAYYAAKAGAIALKSLAGKKSASVMGDPRVLMAPTLPYHTSEDDIFSRGHGLAELPITVVTKARLPFIGTTIAMMGGPPVKLLAKQAAKLPFVNLELHGIDFIDADGDGVGYLKPHQPDVRIPLTKRRRALECAVKTLLDGGLEPVTLRQAATRIFI
jgi:peptidoglycan/xylan/chitin deacetylase (PgdA/CDA1 family)